MKGVDVSITVEEVEAAAATLEKMSIIYEYGNPELGEWCASDLRHELPAIRAYVEAGGVIGVIVKEVEDLIISGKSIEDSLRTVLRGFDVRSFA